MTRRDWLTLAGLGALAGARGVVGNEVATPDAVQRIANVIREYEAQGFHRTGTNVDNASGDWLAEEVGRAGVRATLEPFALDRVDPVTCTLTHRRPAHRRTAAVRWRDSRRQPESTASWASISR